MSGSSSHKFSVFQTTVAIPIAITIWVFVYILFYMLLGLLDNLRGLGNDWIQTIFRELWAPGIGGYAALFLVHLLLPRSNTKIVIWGFCTPLFLFMIGLPVIIIIGSPRESVQRKTEK